MNSANIAQKTATHPGVQQKSMPRTFVINFARALVRVEPKLFKAVNYKATHFGSKLDFSLVCRFLLLAASFPLAVSSSLFIGVTVILGI